VVEFHDTAAEGVAMTCARGAEDVACLADVGGSIAIACNEFAGEELVRDGRALFQVAGFNGSDFRGREVLWSGDEARVGEFDEGEGPEGHAQEEGVDDEDGGCGEGGEGRVIGEEEAWDVDVDDYEGEGGESSASDDKCRETGFEGGDPGDHGYVEVGCRGKVRNGKVGKRQGIYTFIFCERRFALRE
jgi:hypothetical protein